MSDTAEQRLCALERPQTADEGRSAYIKSMLGTLYEKLDSGVSLGNLAKALTDENIKFTTGSLRKAIRAHEPKGKRDYKTYPLSIPLNGKHKNGKK